MRVVGVTTSVLLALCLVGWLLLAGSEDDSDPKRSGGYGASEHSAADQGPRLRGQHGDTPEPRFQEPEPTGLTIEGRVVGSTRVPIEGALISLLLPWDTEPRPRVATDARGAFAIEGLPPADGTGVIIAVATWRDLSGRVLAPVPDSRDRHLDLGVIVAGATGTLAVEVRLPGGRGARGAALHLEALQHPHAHTMARAVCDAAGRRTFDSLPAGRYRVLADSIGFGRAARIATIDGRGKSTLALDLVPERALTVAVRDAATGRAIHSARVYVLERWQDGAATRVVPQVTPQEPALTNAEGVAVLRGLERDRTVGLRVEADGYPAWDDSSTRTRVANDETEVEFQLRARRTLGWRIAAGGDHHPPDAMELRITARAGTGQSILPERVYVRGTHVVAEGCSHDMFHATVHAPDASFAHLFAQAEGVLSGDVTFMALRRVLVVVRDDAGRPVTGDTVTLRNRGHALMARPEQLDEEGQAWFTTTCLDTVTAFLSTSRKPHTGFPIGSAFLGAKPDSRIEAVLSAGRTVELTVTVAGRPQLPARFTLGKRRGAIRVEEEDPLGGRIRFRVLDAPKGPFAVLLRAEGLGERMIDVPEPDASGLSHAAVGFAKAGTALIRIQVPADRHFHVVVYPAELAAQQHASRSSAEAGLVVGEEGGNVLQRHTPLPPGAYVATDLASGTRSAAFHVGADQETRMDLNLSGVGYASGTVLVPPGYRTTGARVSIAGDAASRTMPSSLRGAPVGLNGEFRLRVPADRSVVLEPFHPRLRPAGARGTAEVRGGTQDIILEMAEAAAISFALSGDLPDGTPDVRVRLLADGQATDAAVTHHAHRTRDGRYEVRRIPAGKYRVAILMTSRAPVVVGAVAIDRAQDLGVVAIRRGGILRIRQAGDKGRTLHIAPREHPWLRRTVTTTPGRDLVVSSLMQGVHELTATGSDSSSDPTPLRTIEIDSGEDSTLEVPAPSATR